jgi:Domain of unknown function (DUF3943)
MRHQSPWYGIALICCLCGSARVEAQETSHSEARQGPDFWPAAGGVVVTNWVTWAYNYYVQRWPWAKVGTRSWGENLRRGVVWDDNSFLDNQFSHPLHGSFYHNSARASGFGFWESVPFVAAGSATWEFFGETITASLNDLITTTLGGVALGEVTYRLSTLLGASRGGGRNGFGRELGSFVLSPMAQTQGLVNHRSDHAGPLAHDQTTEPALVTMGRRSGQAFLELAVRYGNPFEPGQVRPYDAFEFRMQVSPDVTGIIQHLAISGLLTRLSFSQSPQQQLVLGVFQHYDFDDLPALATSGHSVSTALLYRRELGARTQLNLSAHAEGLLLGTITSEHGNYWRRDYDVGPGAGARLGAALVRNGREWLRADGRLLWLKSIHGSGGDHLATFVRLGATVPLLGPVGLGGDVAVTTRHSSFPELAPIRRRVQHFRAYLTWAPS